MESLRSKKGFICDMDGVIYHGNQLLPGVKEFVEWLQKRRKTISFPYECQQPLTKRITE